VLVVAAIAMMFWAGPALSTADPELVRMHATQFLLLSSAMIVILIERHIEEAGQPRFQLFSAFCNQLRQRGGQEMMRSQCTREKSRS
jgi:hypothetical protein